MVAGPRAAAAHVPRRGRPGPVRLGAARGRTDTPRRGCRRSSSSRCSSVCRSRSSVSGHSPTGWPDGCFAWWATLVWIVGPLLFLEGLRPDYRPQFKENFLVPHWYGLTNMGDFPSIVLVLWAAWAACKALDSRRLDDAVLAGALAGALVAVKPANAIFAGAPLLVSRTAPALAPTRACGCGGDPVAVRARPVEGTRDRAHSSVFVGCVRARGGRAKRRRGRRSVESVRPRRLGAALGEPRPDSRSVLERSPARVPRDRGRWSG